MKNNYRRYVKDYILQPLNLISTIMAILVSISLMLFRNIKIYLWVLGIITTLLLLVIWYLYIKIGLIQKEIAQTSIINLEVEQFMAGSQDQDSLLLYANNILALGFFVNVFYFDNNVEKKIAVGKVTNIQENKLQQVSILEWSVDEYIKTELLHNNFKYTKNIIVKPIFATK